MKEIITNPDNNYYFIQRIIEGDKDYDTNYGTYYDN